MTRPAGVGPHRSTGSPVAGRSVRLRVAITSDAVRGRNGVGTYYDDLVEHLAGRVEAIEIVSPVGSGRGSSSAGWRFRMPGDRTQTLFVPRIGRLWKEIRSHSPDVIVAPTPGLYGLVGMAAALGSGAVFLLAYHTDFPGLAGIYWKNRPVIRRVMHRLGNVVDAIMFRKASSVLVFNRDLMAEVRDRGVRNVRLMGTPVAASFLAEPLHPVDDRLTEVTYVGRLAPEKRIEQVLEVARALPEIRVRIVGDGPLRERVEECRAEYGNIDLYGWVDRERVRTILDKTDLFVLPSVQETFGTAAFEAMMRGRPVLVSPGCGIAEWAELAAGLFRMEEEESLLDAVRRVRSLDPQTRRSVAGIGREAALGFHERTIAGWIDALDRSVPDTVG